MKLNSYRDLILRIWILVSSLVLFMVIFAASTTEATTTTTITTTKPIQRSLSPLDLSLMEALMNETSSSGGGSGGGDHDHHAKMRLEILTDFIYKYILPILVTIGLVGNSLTIIILSKEHELNSLYDPGCSFRENLRLQYIKHSVCGNGGHDLSSGCINSIGSPTLTEAVTNAQYRKSTKLEGRSKSARSGGKRPASVYNTQFSSTNYFIFSLAVSDLIYNIVLALVWITKSGYMNILNRDYLCQSSVAVTYICSFLSAAFTTLFTFQRFIAIVNPLKSATSFSLQSTRVIRRVIIVLIVFACVAYSYSLFLYDTEAKLAYESTEEDKKEMCGPVSEYKKLVIMLDNTLDSFLTMIVPAVGILFMNFSICRSLSKYNKENIFYSAVNTNGDNLNKSTRKIDDQNYLSSERTTNHNELKEISRCHSLTASRSCTPGRLSEHRHSPTLHASTVSTAEPGVNYIINSASSSNNNSRKNKQKHLSSRQQQQQQYHSAIYLANNNNKNSSSLNRNHNHQHSAQSRCYKSSPTVSINNTMASKRNSSTNMDERGSFCKEKSTLRTSSNVSNSNRITKLLLIVSFCFLILNSPYRAANLISYIHMIIRNSSEITALESFVNEILLNLYFASYSVNFFLYSLCGKKFRESFKGLCFSVVFFFYYRICKLLNCVFKRGSRGANGCD